MMKLLAKRPDSWDGACEVEEGTADGIWCLRNTADSIVGKSTSSIEKAK